MLGRLWIALGAALALTLTWEMAVLLPVKFLVVYVHELGHGFAALLSGAYLQEIHLTTNEWGETLVRSLEGTGSFFFTVSAGYLGSILMGVVLLNRGLVGRWERLTLGLFAGLLFYSGFLFTAPGGLSFFTAMGWALVLGFVCFTKRSLVQASLVLLGVFFVWYCFYDLFDFTRDLEGTDAGILARYWIEQQGFLSGSLDESSLALAFSILWTAGILLIVSLGLYDALRLPKPGRALSEEEGAMQMGALATETAGNPSDAASEMHAEAAVEPSLPENTQPSAHPYERSLPQAELVKGA